MKRFVAIICLFAICISLSSCASNKDISTSDLLTTKAEAILDELPDSDVVSDFREIYNILISLPSNERKFLKGLEEAQVIADKYNFTLESASWYFQPLSPVSAETIEDYKERRVYHDIDESLNIMIYPLLFREYGNDMTHIPNASAHDIRNVLDNLGYYCETQKYGLDYGAEYSREVWCDSQELLGDFDLEYFENDFISYIEIPIAIYDKWEEAELEAYFNESLQRQEEISKEIVDYMLKSFDGFANERNILSFIYTDEEILALENFIKSLTAEYIWANNLYGLNTNTQEETYHSNSDVMLAYEDTCIVIKFGIRSISLYISGVNYINEFSSRQRTLYSAFVSQDTYESLEPEDKDYVDKNTAANKEIPEYAVNLNALIEKNMNAAEDPGAVVAPDISDSISTQDPPALPGTKEIPYIENITHADQPIYSGPSYNFSYVGTVQVAGMYTIIEETLDDEGNLWGRLKSGVGWIDLTESRSDEYTSTQEQSSTASSTEIPYTENVTRADQPIYSGPGYGYSCVGTVQIAGIYTIVEETLDDEGNLWGRLKSGVGWIDLTDSRYTS